MVSLSNIWYFFNFLNRLKKERPDLSNKIDDLIGEINNPPTEVNFGDIDPFTDRAV